MKTMTMLCVAAVAFVLEPSASAQEPKPVPAPVPAPAEPKPPEPLKTPEKVEVKTPLRFVDTELIKVHKAKLGPDGIPKNWEDKGKRLGFTESKDDIEGTVARHLSFQVQSEFWMVGLRQQDITLDTESWVLSCEIDDKGKPTLTLRWSAMIERMPIGLGIDGPLEMSKFLLVHRSADTVREIVCHTASASKIGDSRLESVTFRLSPTDVLELADAGSWRMKYPKSRKEQRLSAIDVEALRWFVWEKVPGGQDLVRARYKMVPRESVPAKPVKQG